MALLLLDNAVEILMYRKIKEELKHSNFYKQLLDRYSELPETIETKKHKEELVKNVIPSKKIESINKYFPEKANFLENKNIMNYHG